MLQMQTLIGLLNELIDPLLGFTSSVEDTELRSHSTAGKRVKQEAMLMVIKFITSLKVSENQESTKAGNSTCKGKHSGVAKMFGIHFQKRSLESLSPIPISLACKKEPSKSPSIF